ncbi:protein of unknown function (DU1801) [Geodermatophilus africanus]|uniref:YdhG-like domain-containing protein n=1 Tax=Geodermatophilus africanus TaxID=1137993 RepID=A0A1H3NG49_9ACTN|nr:DUF1801 domain-containing protein [Geodermatophilus africanus]SDY87887.1 protein of unknown function (DU1801) [Geodermatophilus africanus]
MDADIEEWFAAAGPREGELRAADALVVAAAPGIDRQLVAVGSGQMLGYGLMPYRPRSARETTTWPLIALAAQKRHLSLYVCAVVDGTYLAEARAERLGRVSCGKSCIRFSSLDRLDRAELTALLQDAVAATRAGANGYSAG